VVFVKNVTEFGEVGILVTGVIIYKIILKDLSRRRIKGIIKFKPGYIIFEVGCAVIKINNVIINDVVIINRVNGCVINNIIKLLNIIGRLIFLL